MNIKEIAFYAAAVFAFVLLCAVSVRALNKQMNEWDRQEAYDQRIQRALHR